MLELGYVEATSTLSTTATTEAGATTWLTLPAIVTDGSQVVVLEFGCPSWTASVTTRIQFVVLFDALNGGAAAAVARLWESRAWVASASIMGFVAQYRFTPASGSHVWSARGHLSASGTFTVEAGAAGAGATEPAYLRAVQVEFA